MSATAAAMIQALNSYKEYRAAEKQYERTKKLQELERRAHQEKADRAKTDAFASIQALEAQQFQTQQKQSGLETELSIDAAKRRAALNAASGGILGGSQTTARLGSLIDLDLETSLTGSRATARNQLEQLEREKDAAILRASPTTLFQLNPEKPDIWDFIVSGGAAAGAEYSRGSGGSSYDQPPPRTSNAGKGNNQATTNKGK